MISYYLFFLGTLLLSLNFVEFVGFAVSDLLFFSAFFFMLLETLVIDRKNINIWLRQPFIIPVWLIMFGAVISTYYSRSAEAAFAEIIQQIYVMTIFISMITILVFRQKDRGLIKAFILSGVFTASIALFDYLTGSRIGPILSGSPEKELWYRYAGTLEHPNKFGYFLALTSILTISIIPTEAKSSRKIFWLILLCIQLFGIFLSGSVTAYVGVLFGFGTWLISRTNIRKSFFNLIVVGLVLILLMGFSGGLLGIYSYRFNLQDPTNVIFRSIDRVRTTTSTSRLSVYQEAFQSILESPIIGAGFDQLSTSGISGRQRELSNSIHNPLIQIWYAGGLLPLLGYLILYIQIGIFAFQSIWNKELLKCFPMLSGIAVAAISSILMDQFQDTIYPREKWLVIGLLAGYYYVCSQATQINPDLEGGSTEISEKELSTGKANESIIKNDLFF